MYKPFLDNTAIYPILKGHYLDEYSKPEEVTPGICHYVQKSIQAVDEVLTDVERAGRTISEQRVNFLS